MFWSETCCHGGGRRGFRSEGAEIRGWCCANGRESFQNHRIHDFGQCGGLPTSPWPGVPAASPRASPLAPGAFSWQMQDSRALGSLHSLALLFLAKADWDKSMKALLPNHPVPNKYLFLRCYLHSRTPSKIRQGIGCGLKSQCHVTSSFPPVGFPHSLASSEKSCFNKLHV